MHPNDCRRGRLHAEQEVCRVRQLRSGHFDVRRLGFGGSLVYIGSRLPRQSAVHERRVRVSRATRLPLAYSSICVPISTTRFGGIEKKSVAERELRDRNRNNRLRQNARLGFRVGSSVSRPR